MSWLRMNKYTFITTISQFAAGDAKKISSVVTNLHLISVLNSQRNKNSLIFLVGKGCNLLIIHWHLEWQTNKWRSKADLSVNLADYNDNGGIPMTFTSGPSIVWISSEELFYVVASNNSLVRWARCAENVRKWNTKLWSAAAIVVFSINLCCVIRRGIYSLSSPLETIQESHSPCCGWLMCIYICVCTYVYVHTHIYMHLEFVG